jgi:nitrate reductase (NAD(P)H)
MLTKYHCDTLQAPAFGGYVKEINKADENTKDDWVPRHSEMIRLTGRHPFNSEPPPARLMESYITPAPLHYVRNHGAVPQVSYS